MKPQACGQINIYEFFLSADMREQTQTLSVANQKFDLQMFDICLMNLIKCKYIKQ